MSHLDPQRIAAILEGTLPPEEAAFLRQHLAAPCTRCEEALNNGPDLDTLLRLVEAEGAPPVRLPDRDRSWQVVRAALPMGRGHRAAWWVGAALAAALALIVLRPQVATPPDHLADGIKGATTAMTTVQLRVIVGHEEGGRFALDSRLAGGEVVAHDQTLLFELETDRPAARYLFAVQSNGTVLLLAPPEGEPATVSPAGRSKVEAGGQWVALDLADQRGPITLVAAASPSPLDLQREVIDPWLAGDHPRGLRYDSLSIVVSE